MPWAILGVGFSMVVPQAQLNAELEDIYRKHGDSFVVHGEMNSADSLWHEDLRDFEVVVVDKRPVVVRLPAGRGFVEYWPMSGGILRIAGAEHGCETLSMDRGQDDAFSYIRTPESISYLLLRTLSPERVKSIQPLMATGKLIGDKARTEAPLWEQLSSRAGTIKSVSVREVTARDVVIRPATSVTKGATVYAGWSFRLAPVNWESDSMGHLLADPQIAYSWLSARIGAFEASSGRV